MFTLAFAKTSCHQWIFIAEKNFLQHTQHTHARSVHEVFISAFRRRFKSILTFFAAANMSSSVRASQSLCCELKFQELKIRTSHHTHIWRVYSMICAESATVHNFVVLILFLLRRVMLVHKFDMSNQNGTDWRHFAQFRFPKGMARIKFAAIVWVATTRKCQPFALNSDECVSVLCLCALHFE